MEDINLKEKIVEIVNLQNTVSHKVLTAYLTLILPEEKDSIFERAISELVQANLIRRYEYKLKNASSRSAFYMPVGSKLMD